MLDRLSPAVRHLALLALGALLSALAAWVQSDLSGVLGDTVLAPFAGAIVTVLLAVLTPLTRQYGVGSSATGMPTDT